MSPRRETLRRIGRWTVIAAAGLASIATSPARWSLQASVPATARAGKQGRLVTIEASSPPTVARGREGDVHEREVGAEDRGTWGGRGLYYLPPGTEIRWARVSNLCTSGGMCSACDPPPGAFVRVTKVEAVEPWSVEATSEEQTTRLAGSTAAATYYVDLEATGPIEVDVAITSGQASRLETAVRNASLTPLPRRFAITLMAKEGSDAMEFKWKARATIHDYCRDPTCSGRDTARVTIQRVEVESPTP